MSKITTDYGLVYNTDGSLCVTKRTDIVPFPGVTSFAVETGTTNLVQNPQFLNDTANYGINNWGGTGYIEVVNNIMNMHNESSTVDLALTQDFTIDNTKEHTISCRVRSANGQDCPIHVHFDAGYYHIGTAPANGAWVTLERTYAPSELAASSSMHFRIPSGKYLQIDWLQFEQKPFASSFVNGSRPAGRLVRPVNLLGFNPATDDWVVHYWKYPVATHNDSLNGHNLCSFGQWTSDYSLGYIYWGKILDSNKFIIRVTYSDSTEKEVYSSSFDPNWYFRNWHHEVLLKHRSEMQYWIDGTLQIQLALAKPLLNNFIVGLTLGGISGASTHNSYIANLCYGLYTDQWTPEFIQEQAAMTQGYYVPPRKVIE